MIQIFVGGSENISGVHRISSNRFWGFRFANRDYNYNIYNYI